MPAFKLKRAFNRVGAKAKSGISATLVFGTGIAKSIAGTVGALSKSGVNAVLSFTSASFSWLVPSISFNATGQTSNLVPTGPSGYATGGAYDVDTSGNPLPANVSLSSAGLITNNGAAAGTTNNIVFGYNEPNALPILTLNPTQTGTLPYEATVYANEGVVPTGRFLVSPDDTNLRSSTLATWPDASARILVVSSSGLAVTSGTPKTVSLRLNNATDVAGTALTVARIQALVTSIGANFGSSLTLTIASATPDLIWWANSQSICARYRLAIANKGVMEAVIDIHAFASPSNRALVEVVVENGQVNPAAVANPADQQYYGAMISVNGAVIKTVNTSDAIHVVNWQTPAITITNITKANPAVFTYNIAAQGDRIYAGYNLFGVLSVAGMTELNGKEARLVDSSIGPAWNGPNFQLEILDRATMTWNPINSTSYGTFTSGTWNMGSAAFGFSLAHNRTRAWFCETWVGGDPGTEITHDTAYMQKLPCFNRYSNPANKNYQTYVPPWSFDLPSGQVSQAYAADQYQPWGIGRHSSMQGNTGDHVAIGPLPHWEAHYLISGDKYVRRAVIASSLSYLSFALNARSTVTNLVPSFTECAGKTSQADWMNFPGGNFGREIPHGSIEVAHQPAQGLLAFLCRPAPCFIELAQKIAHVNGVANAAGNQKFGYWFQTRGKAWCFRNLAHAVFLTPDAVTGARASQMQAWKTSAAASMATNVTFFMQWDACPEDKLNTMWESAFAPGYSAYDRLDGGVYFDHGGGGAAGFEHAVWMDHFFAPEAHKAHQCKLVTGTAQTNLNAFADWLATQSVRWVNEQPSGSWRYIGYRTVIGTVKGSNDVGIGQPNTWAQARAIANGANLPASVSGLWYTQGGDEPPNFTTTYWGEDLPSLDTQYGFNYVRPFWASLCTAVERSLSGADTAWNTVTGGNITNLATWLASCAIDPRHKFYPRNK